MEPEKKEVQKKVYVATFEHKQQVDQATTMHVVAADFENALRKASDNKALMQAGKDDEVELQSIEVLLAIDVE